MQFYRVKLKKNHIATPNIVVNGYLGSGDEIYVYSADSARKKARIFNGEIEPYGKNYNIEVLKILQLPKSDISESILQKIAGKETFTDTDNELNELVYSADIFDIILEEQMSLNSNRVSDDILNELRILCKLCLEYSYIMLISI